MSQWFMLALSFTGLVGWCLYRVPAEVRNIEQDLLAQSTKALANARIPIPGPGALKVNGMDITLTGIDGTPIVSEASQRLVAGVRGVHEVHLRITAAPPPPPPPPLSGDALKLETAVGQFLELKQIRFEGNTDAIRLESKLLLEQVSRILLLTPTVSVAITVHAASPDLALRRAEAVKKYLALKGIVPERMSVAAAAMPAPPPRAPVNAPVAEGKVEFHAVAK